MTYMETNKTYRNETTGNWAKIVPTDSGYKVIRGFGGRLMADPNYTELTKTKRAAIVYLQKWLED